MTAFNINTPALTPLESPEPGTFEAIYRALDFATSPLIGRANVRLLAIPIHADDGSIAGGLWGGTLFQWLHVQLLVVPEELRGRGVGTLLMFLAEAEARRRGCCGAFLDALAAQAAAFYEKLGYVKFGELADFPPGHRRIYMCKRFTSNERQTEPATVPAGLDASVH